MPCKPPPLKVKCPKCGWHQTYTSKSDAIMQPLPETCPKCGHNQLDITAVKSIIGKWLARLGLIKRVADKNNY